MCANQSILINSTELENRGFRSLNPSTGMLSDFLTITSLTTWMFADWPMFSLLSDAEQPVSMPAQLHADLPEAGCLLWLTSVITAHGDSSYCSLSSWVVSQQRQQCWFNISITSPQWTSRPRFQPLGVLFVSLHLPSHSQSPRKFCHLVGRRPSFLMKVKGTNDKLGKTQDCLDCLELIKRSVSAYTCLYPLSFEQGVNLLKTKLFWVVLKSA